MNSLFEICAIKFRNKKKIYNKKFEICKKNKYQILKNKINK